MTWIKLLLERKLIVGFAVLLLIIMGFVFIDKLENQFYPEVNYDTVTISAESENMPAIEMEKQITTPIEQEISDLEGIKSFQSSSTDGLSSIEVILQENGGTETFEQLKDSINIVQQNIPNEEISISRSTTSQTYEMFLDIYGGDLNEMTLFSENILKPRLESLQEVRKVRLVGQNEKKINVELNPRLMNSYDLTYEEVRSVLKQQNVHLSIGDTNSDQPPLNWETSIENLNDISFTMFSTESGSVFLSDIASISVKETRTNEELWRNGDSRYVWVSIARPNDVTQSQMTNAVRSELNNIRDEGHVNGFNMDQTIVQSDFVKDSIGNLQTNVLIGGILVIIVLFMMFRNITSTAIIGISIPITVLMTFILMALFDLSINLISILGLGIGLGMVVDSSIVILESIYKKKEEGYNDREATILGTKEVFTPVLSSTLTTMVVFLPIGLISGQIGDFAKVLSIVIIFSQISSLIISFTLIPVLSEKLLKVRSNKRNKRQPKYFKKYNEYIDWVSKNTKRRMGVLVIFIVISCSSWVLALFIPVSMIPDFYNRQAEFYVALEPNTNFQERERVADGVSEFLSSTKDVVGYNVRKLDQSRMYVYVKMTPENEATVQQNEINESIHENLREMSSNYPVTTSGSVTYPIEVFVKGSDLDQLEKITQDLSNKFANVEGVQGITSSLDNSKPSKDIELNMKNVIEDGVSPTLIQNTLQLYSKSEEITSYQENGLEIPVMLKFGVDLQNSTSFNNLNINTPSGDKALGQYISLNDSNTLSKISHKNGERTISILGDIKGNDLGSVSNKIKEVVNNYNLEQGYTIELGGEIEQQQNTSNEMYLVLSMALLLVFAIMSVQFNNLVHPLVVMFIIPLTLTGVLIGLFVTQTVLNLLSAMGMLILIGIVVNNGILLIDRIKQLRLAQEPRFEAIKTACKERSRPIFITFITTVSAALPLALTTGHSGQYQKPMAIALIFGLSFAVFITLLFVPVVYILFEDAVDKVKNVFKRDNKLNKNTNLNN